MVARVGSMSDGLNDDLEQRRGNRHRLGRAILQEKKEKEKKGS